MTFGQALKQLLSISGIKSAQLAEALGYDTSYISRWINDIKMPSLKNNDDLFVKIANFIAANSDDAAAESLKYACSAGGGTACLQDAIVRTLRAAYDSSSSITALQASANASFLPESTVGNGNSMLADAIVKCALEKGVSKVNCITSTPLSISSNKDTVFWNLVLSNPEISGKIDIVLHQIVNMSDFAQNIDSYCAAICTFASYRKGVRYRFYKDESEQDCYSVRFIAVEDVFLYLVVCMPVSNAFNVINCSDGNALSSNYYALKNRLRLSQRLLHRCSCSDLDDGHFLYDYMMDGKLRYLLNMMHPIYMSRGLSEKLVEKYFPDEAGSSFYIYYNTMCANMEKEVIIFRSSLLEYIYSGNIYLFGKTITIRQADRHEHLMELLEQIEKGDCRLTILSDINPLLCREDMNLSLYLSRNVGFGVSMTEDDSAFKFSSHRTVQYFNQFFSHIQSLGAEYVLKDKAAEDFIRRGLRFCE